MSKESVNRLPCAAFLVFVWGLCASPAAAQVALVVGSVRDQHGAAIQGASVTARGPAGTPVTATTDAAGTFALEADGVRAVDVTCRYCLASHFDVRQGEPVVAIVRRFDALLSQTPTSSDLANLPYAHVESTMALRPFTLLEQSTYPYPGSRLSDRGLASYGSLLVDAGVPNYDIVSGNSPYTPIPAGYEQAGQIASASNAFLYGDQAGGGTVFLQPFAEGDDLQVATLGSDEIFRAQAGSDSAEVAAGSYSNSSESRQRADGRLVVPMAGDGVSLQLAGGTEQGREFSTTSGLDGAFSFADADFGDRKLANLSFDAVVDRGVYALTYGGSQAGSVWSDASFDASVHSNAPFQVFAGTSTRFSTGSYDLLAFSGPRIGATLVQSRADAGFDTSASWYAASGGVGMFWVNYNGGSEGYSTPFSAAFATPSLQATLFPNGRFSATVEGSGSFSLPTFALQYSYPDATSTVDYTRNSLFAGTLDYTDDARLRLSFEAATQSVRGASFGTTTSMGFAGTWQVAPALSLRAWAMHVTDSSAYGAYGNSYGAIAPTTGALWATYDNGGAVRIDAIYRRDLLDNAPFYHVDGDVSGPISNRLRWYAGVEDRQRVRYLDAGIRFGSP